MSDRYPSYFCPYCGQLQGFKFVQEEWEKLETLKLECCKCAGVFMVGKKDEGK